jgi:GNAT superfamily N-acetyltransferase
MTKIEPIAYSAALFAPMLAEAGAGDGTFLLRLRDEWATGAIRFDKEGEILLGAFSDGALIGVGGLSHDPYGPEAGLVRLRHLYVLEAERGRGVGRKLVARLVDHARAHFSLVRLRTRNPEAARLYEGLGFVASGRANETHRLAF